MSLMEKKKNQKISYEDIEAIVEQLVRIKSNNAVFDCWEIDDIAQEIRIICLNALEHFDEDRVIDSKTINYFGRCVDYRLQNLKRDKYIRFTPHFTKEQINEAISDPNSDMAAKYEKFKENVKRRKKVKHPISIEQTGEKTCKFNFINEVDAKDFCNFLVNNIEEELREPLLRMISGNEKGISKEIKERIRNFVMEMLDDQQ